MRMLSPVRAPRDLILPSESAMHLLPLHCSSLALGDFASRNRCHVPRCDKDTVTPIEPRKCPARSPLTKRALSFVINNDLGGRSDAEAGLPECSIPDKVKITDALCSVSRRKGGQWAESNTMSWSHAWFVRWGWLLA